MRTGNSWLAYIAILGMLPFTAPAANRPRVALVLEGGGALGFAHIGVIEWLEQNHIPIDYVAGTSMGALVGGIYATGRSPAQIRELVGQINWDEVLAGQTPFQDLSYRRKEDKIAYPNRLEFGLRGGFNLPGGLNSGHQVGLVLDRAMLPYYDLKTFDDLPIPFRCVATDLIAGKAKIFSNGSLARALRATMSIPGVFSPVSMNGTMYSDGQAVDNFPVDVGRAMGADIVIGVYLDTGVQDPKSYGSLLGVVGRNLSIMVSANELRGLKTADILINVNLKGFSALDFNRSGDIIPLGTQAAVGKRAMLSRLSVSDEEWRAYTALRASRQKTDVPTPEFVAVDGTSPVKVKAIKAEVDQFAGKKIDPPQLEATLTKLSGWGYFDSVNYSLTRRQSETGLQIHAEEKAYGPPFLNAGIQIDGADVNDVRFGFSTRLTVMNVGNLRAEWRTDAFFGTTYGVTTEYFRPFNDTTKWFIAPRLYITRNQFDIYNDQNRIAQYFQVRKGGGIDLGYSLGSRAEIRLGEDGAWYDTRRNIGVPLAPNSGLGLGITSLRFQYLGQDDASVPRKGYINQSSLQWFSARPDGAGYFSAQTRMGYFKPVSVRGSVFGTASGGTTFGASGLDLQAFSLGGPFQLSAYGRNELLGDQYFLFQAGYLHQLARLNILTGGVLYATAFYELGKMYSAFNFPSNLPSLPNDVSFAAIAKTAIGPVFIGGSLGDSSRRKWWFGVGRVF